MNLEREYKLLEAENPDLIGHIRTRLIYYKGPQALYAKLSAKGRRVFAACCWAFRNLRG